MATDSHILAWKIPQAEEPGRLQSMGSLRVGHGTLIPSAQRLVWAAKQALGCNPIDSSPPGSPVPGILQAKTLEWVAITFSNA